MFLDIINELSKRGLAKEAEFLRSIEKKANQIGRNQRLKELLVHIFKENGQTPYNNNGPIRLDITNDRWGNINSAFKFFLEKNLHFTADQAQRASTDWAGNASKIGRGYRPTREGMIDLLEDSYGGRAQVGSSLDGSGMAEQTPDLVNSIEQMRRVRESTDPLNSSLNEMLGRDRGRAGRSEDFKARREELKSMLRREKRVFESNDGLVSEAPDESGAQAMTEDLAGTYMLGGWMQERDSNGVIRGYKKVGDKDMLRKIESQTLNLSGTMVEKDVHPDSPTFTLALGPSRGEVVVGNIGHRPVSGNNWAKINN
tara:strand:- start:1143 stop:2081 length:939 start_codon:yes stop_codon:yes gene_type:complete